MQRLEYTVTGHRVVFSVNGQVAEYGREEGLELVNGIGAELLAVPAAPVPVGEIGPSDELVTMTREDYNALRQAAGILPPAEKP